MQVTKPAVGMCFTRYGAESYFRIVKLTYIGRKYFKAVVQMFRLHDDLALYGGEFDAKIELDTYLTMDRVTQKEGK